MDLAKQSRHFKYGLENIVSHSFLLQVNEDIFFLEFLNYEKQTNFNDCLEQYLKSKMKSIIRFNTQKGPKAIGPYSTASIYNGVIYLSGQIGLDPSTGELVGDDVESQTKRVMENIKTILEELKRSFADVIKCTVYLKSMGDFATVNNIYGPYFPKNEYPTRVAIAVAQLPKGAKVEIECLIAHPEAKL